MSDLSLRRLERSAAQGGPAERARALLGRIRTGQIPYEHVIWASHLGDPICREIESRPDIVVDCFSCRSRREIRRRRNRDPRSYPTPVSETPAQCLRCRGSEKIGLDKGLIRFVQSVEGVPQRLLISWAVDCAEHQIEKLSPRNTLAFQGRYRLPNTLLRDPTLEKEIIPCVRRWLGKGIVDPVLYHHGNINVSIHRGVGVIPSLAVAVVRFEIEEEKRTVRFRLASVATSAYHASGGTRVERNWQERRLIQYLLDEF